MFALTPQVVQVSNTVVIGTLLVGDIRARILFDSGATYSFASSYFISHLRRDIEFLEAPIIVFTQVENPIEVLRVLSMCPMMIDGYRYDTDLIVLEILGFDVILGMDWLSAYQATLNYREKTITLKLSGDTDKVFQGNRSEEG